MNKTVIGSLKQRHVNERREFYLEPHQLRVYVKDIDGEVESLIEYEALTRQRRQVTKQTGWLYVVAVSFGLFGLVGILLNLAGDATLMRWTPLWLVASLIFLGFHAARRRRYTLIDLTNEQALYFLRDKPNQADFERFLTLMYDVQRNYVRTTYFVYEPGNDPDSEFRKLQWLLRQGFISDAEFHEMRTTIAVDHGFDASGSKADRVLH